MSITRITVVDDTGDGTSGTPITAAWWAQVQDMIDGRWSVAQLNVSGVVNDLNISEADVVIFTNTAPLTLTGIATPANPGKTGKTVRLIHYGSAPVYLMPTDGRSLASSRFQNYVTPGPAPLMGGWATYAAWGPGLPWLMVDHNQGSAIDTPLTANVFTASVGTFAPGGGSSYRFMLSGKYLDIDLGLVACNVSTTGALLSVASPLGDGVTPGNGGYIYKGTAGLVIYRSVDAGVVSAAVCSAQPSNRNLLFYSTLTGSAWQAAAGTCRIEMIGRFELV